MTECAPVSVAVDVLVFTVQAEELKILLVHRSQPPFEGQWAVPGGFLGETESAGETARRKLREKTGVQNVHLEQLYTFSRVDRDPRKRVLSVSYLAAVPGRLLMDRREEQSKLFTVSMDGTYTLHCDNCVLRDTDLAFDHGEMIRTAVSRMQGKLDYTDLAFSFLESVDAFSMTELYGVFCAVLGKNMDRSNFNRMIRNRYEMTGRLVRVGQKKSPRGRPADLYRLREGKAI